MTETKARAGKDLADEFAPAPPGAEVKSAMAGFLDAFNGFQSEVKQALQLNQDRLNKLERKTMTYARPALSTAAELDMPHKKAMAAYLRSGDDDGLRGLVLEGKAMSGAVNADGGFLLNPQMAEKINSMLGSTTSLRALANVVQIDATSYDVIIDNSDPGSAWQSEIAAVAESSTPSINRISIKLNDLSAMPKISQRLLDDASFDVEGWIAERIATRFVRAEASAFVNGTGVDQPKGFLLPNKVANASWTWGNLGYIPTGAAADFASTNPIDCLVTLIYSLAADYRANATFVMNSKTAGAVRKIKDSTGRFMWNDSMAAGQPATLMGYRVVILEDMPDIGSNTYPIAFGDFNAGYTIAERPDLRILRDPFSAKPNVLFYASKRVGGDITDYAAIKLLKVAVS
jgi:HK97 family phage major capsid protein